ncbi:MAG: hypothetical protein FIA97_18505 [Methylococcaceae bacterium]|nr:hypothetical protein [Methylococcaceae bacterium]
MRGVAALGFRLVLGWAAVAAMVSGCRAERAPGAGLPNPAVVKCRDDGWRTEPTLVNGIPSGTVCVDPATGTRCEAWSYFRKECPPRGSPAAGSMEPDAAGGERTGK